jgi:hypothetical protein
MSRISFTEDMNEVTGLGGYYERCCRTAIIAGAKWCIEHGQFDLSSVTHAIGQALVARDDGQKAKLDDELTQTQSGLVMYHVRYIADHGWNKYRECMTAPVKVYE